MLNIATENICKCPVDDPAGGREIKMTDYEKTIRDLCDWIQKELKNTSSSQTESILPEMILALAELVKAIS